MNASSPVASVEGHRITLTHLNKVLSPETGTTKADVLGYYAAIADVLIPHAANRPATRKRWVHGVGTLDDPGPVFFQKNLEAATPSWVKRREIQHRDHVTSYPLVNDLTTLTWLGQMCALEIHVPQWQFGRTGTPRNPDRFVLDLDPRPGVGLLECAEVARWARAILQDMGLEAMPVTSGSKGIHLNAALDLSYTCDQVSAVAHELARALEADHRDLVVSDMKKVLRPGKVFIDWSQNNAAKTTITPYSLRERSYPMVATPRTWKELTSTELQQLDYKQVLARLKRRDDPLAQLGAGSFEHTRGRPPPTASRRTASRYTATSGTGVKRRSLCRHPFRATQPDRVSSFRSTMPAACTGISGSDTTGCWCRGLCRAACRCHRPRTGLRYTWRTIRSNTAASREIFRLENMVPATSRSGIAATTTSKSGSMMR